MSDIAAWDARYSADASHIGAILAMLPDLQARSATLAAIRALGLPHARVLEIGCGTGQHSVALAREFPGWTFEAIDMSPKAIEAARALAAAGGVTVAFAVGDAGTLPYADASFDVIFGDHVIGHVPDRGLVEREIVRVLKTGGSAVLNSGNALRPDGWPLYHALSDKSYLARSLFPWTLAHEFAVLGCVKTGSFGSVLILTRGLSLLRKCRSRTGTTNAKTGTVRIDIRRPGLVTRLYRALDANAPAWLKTDYGVIVKKM